jgi:hypothetical protein
VKIFYHFFEEHPEVKAVFPKFKDVDLDHLKELPAFKDHATKIYHIMDDFFMKQDFSKIDELSTFHKGIDKTDKVPFNKFRQTFYDSVVKHTGHGDDWNFCLDKFFEHFFSQF